MTVARKVVAGRTYLIGRRCTQRQLLLRPEGICRAVLPLLPWRSGSLARDLHAVTLAEVYDALGTTTLFGIGHRDEQPSCPIEQAINRTVGAALVEAEELLMKRLRGTSVAEVLVGARRSKVGEAKSGSKPPRCA